MMPAARSTGAPSAGVQPLGQLIGREPARLRDLVASHTHVEELARHLDFALELALELAF